MPTNQSQAYQYATVPVLGPLTIQDLFMLCYACQDAELTARDKAAADPAADHHRRNAEHYAGILSVLHSFIKKSTTL